MPVSPHEYSFKEYEIKHEQETIRFYIHTPGFSPAKSTFISCRARARYLYVLKITMATTG
jgi:hypothetical protein